MSANEIVINMVDSWRSIARINKIDFYENEKYFLLNTGLDNADANYVYSFDELTIDGFKQIKTYFGGLSFAFRQIQNTNNNLPHENFRSSFTLVGMEYNLENFSPFLLTHDIRICKNKNEWIEVAKAGFGFDREMIESAYPQFDNDEFILVIAYYNNQPAGIAMLYLDENSIGVYWVTVKPEYRRLKIATQIMQFCLNQAKLLSYKKVILTATKEGNELYKSIGFKEQIIIEQYNY